MPKLALNGTQLNYLTTGEGADVVLVHGLASNLAFWYAGIVLQLRNDYRVTAYDLRGHGGSGMPSSGYTHSEMADDLLRLVDHLRLERFHLIGHSYGGLISLSFAVRHPERLKSITLADTPIEGDLVDPSRAGWFGFRDKIQERGIAIDPDELYPELAILEGLAQPRVREAIRHVVPVSTFMPFAWGNGSPRTAARWLEMLTKTSARYDIRKRTISRETLASILLPTLAIYGQRSRYVRSAEILRECLQKVKVVYVQNTGHFHPWERPAEFIANWRSFVADTERRHSALEHDRRRHDRVRIELPLIVWEAQEKDFSAKSLDVSRRGLLVVTRLNFEIGANLHFTAAPNGNGADATMPMTVKVIRRRTDQATRGQMFGTELVDAQQFNTWENMMRQGSAEHGMPLFLGLE